MIEPFQRRNLFEAQGLCMWYTFFCAENCICEVNSFLRNSALVQSLIGIVFFKAIPMAPDTRWLQRRREDRQGGGEKEEREEIRKRRKERRGKGGKGEDVQK